MVANPQLGLKVRIFPGYTPATYTTALNGTDITSYVRLEEGISFSRGASDETSFPAAGRCTFILNNRDYRFTPDNTTSPLFPNVKNKMPMRIERAATASFSVTAISRFRNDVTLTVPLGHGVVVGQTVAVTGATNAVNNGAYLITAVFATELKARGSNQINESVSSASGQVVSIVWTGFVETVEERWNAGLQPTVVISASDYLAQYSRQRLTSTVTAEQLQDSPRVLYPFDSESGVTVSADASGNGNGAMRRVTIGTTTTATLQTQTFGVGQFGSDPDSNVLQLSRHSTTIGYCMGANVSLSAVSTGTVEGYFYLPLAAMTNATLLRVETGSTAYAIMAASPATMVSTNLTTDVATTRLTGNTITIDDYAWHHLALTWVNNGSTTTWRLYVDGVQEPSSGTTTWAETASAGPSIQAIYVGGAPGGTPTTCWAANVAVYNSVLSAATLADRTLASAGYVESSSSRFTRIMGLAGASYSVSSSTAAASIMGPQPTNGQTLLDILQQINDAEDGAIYLDASGVTQYVPQDARDQLTAVITVDPKYISPSTTIMRAPASVNTVIATRANGSGSVTAKDATSVTENGVMSESISLYVNNDADLQRVANRRLYRRATQQPRIGNVVVDLATSTAVNDALLGADIGTYLSVGPLPRGTVDTLLVRIEGINDSITPTSWQRTFVTSPAYRAKSGTNWVLGTSLLDYTTTLA